MLVLGKRVKELKEGRVMAEKSIADGSAWEKFRMLVGAQGGDVAFVDDPGKLPKAGMIEAVKAPRSGFISQVHARTVGEAAVALGAGRAKKGDPIDHAVGFVIHKKVGDRVEKDEPLFEIHANNAEKLAEARKSVLSAHIINDDSVPPLPLFYE
jgi:pyrimidine-nucleoside phosphorylase